MLKTVIFISLSALIFACAQKEEKIVSIYDDIHLELNDGEKWDVSDNMMRHMEKSFTAISKLDKSDKKDYRKLIESLNKQKDLFVSSCDMEGEGHEVLHQWLIPYMGLIESLENAITPEERKDAFEQLKMAKTVFKNYFE